MSETNLYRKPGDILRDERDRLAKRLAEERGEVKRFEALAGKTSDELAELVWRAKDDAKQTAKLLAEFKAAVKAVAE